MRILIVVHQFFPEFAGGTERVALNLARMAQRAGHHVRILACAVDPDKFQNSATLDAVSGMLETVYQGVPVSLLRRCDLPAAADIGLQADATLTQNLMEWIHQQRFDVAHIMHTMRMGSALMAIQKSAVPYVVHLTDFYLPCARVNLIDLENNLCPGPDEGRRCALQCAVPPWTTHAYAERYFHSRAVLDAAGARIAPSEYVADCYRKAYPGITIQVIPHGIDLLALSAVQPRQDSSANGPIRLIYIGSIVRPKGLDVLLRALALLPDVDLELRVVGGFYGDALYQKEIRHLLSNDPRVTLCGVLEADDVFSALTQSDVLCLPSKVPETFSLALHESAAAGVPMLVSDLGAPARQVASSECGWVLPSGNSKAWADALRALSADRSLISDWKQKLFLPLRIEEEAFFINSLYLRLQKVSR